MSKKIILIIVFLSVFISASFAQNKNIKEGAYRNIVEFHKNTPFFNLEEADIEEDVVRARKKYYIIHNKSGKRMRDLYKKIWSVYKDSCFYLNYSRIGIEGYGFAKVEEFGRYLFIMGNRRMTVSQRDRLIKNSFDFGLIGGTITNLNIMNENSSYYHLFDLKTGVPKPITAEYIEFILKTEEDLLVQYQFEREKGYLEIILKYVHLLNSRIPVY